MVVAEADTTAGIKSQVQQIFDQAEEMMSLADSDKSRVLSVTIYPTDFANFDALNEVWEAWPRRLRAAVHVKAELANPELLVEMSFMVAAGEKFQ